MRSRVTSIIALIAAIGLVVSGCGGGGSGADASGSSESSFSYVIDSDPTSLNPINVGDRWGLTTTNILYSPLARVEADGTISNDLAESIEPAKDGLSVTVTLKPDLKWSDGEPLTAEDVEFTYTQKAKRENGNADALYVGGKPITAKAEDERTVRFELPSVSAAALTNIATETFIIPEHVYGDVSDFSVTELDPIAVGSGPYKLDEYKRGEYLSFSPNPNYAGEKPGIDKLTLRIVSNADTVKTALQTGEVDGSFVQPAQVAEFEGTDVTTYPYAEGRVAYLGVNAAKLTDVKARQALFYSLDRQQLNDGAFLSSEFYQNANSILPPGNPFATEDVETYDHDLAAAEQALGEANVKKLTLGFTSADPAQSTQATLIQEQAAKAGITVTLAGVDANALYPEIEKGAKSKFDIFLGGYIMGNDPDAYSALFRTDASSNFFGYSNPKTDDLFDQGVAELDETKRTEIYADLQRQIADDAVFYPMADNLKILAVNQRITGVEDAKPVPIYTLENFGSLRAS